MSQGSSTRLETKVGTLEDNSTHLDLTCVPPNHFLGVRKVATFLGLDDMHLCAKGDDR
jgi:hypothetical protein